MSSERVDRAQRTISASSDVIYRAFLEPSLLETWLPPMGMSGKVHEFYASVGGGYVMSLYHRAATLAIPGKTTEYEDRFRVVFDKLIPGQQIVQRVVFEATDPSFAGTMKQTWTFAGSRQETTVSVACENVPSGIRPEDHAVGLKSSLQNLARALEAVV